MNILRFTKVQDNIYYSLLLAIWLDVRSDYIKCQDYLYEVFISDFAKISE